MLTGPGARVSVGQRGRQLGPAQILGGTRWVSFHSDPIYCLPKPEFLSLELPGAILPRPGQVSG